MYLMALSLATLGVRELKDASKCAHLLGELSNLSVDFTVVQENYFTCAADLSGAGGCLCRLFSIEQP